MSDFTFFDVETPNRSNDKICSLGVIRTDDEGNALYQNHFLINPESGFDPINSSIHGIKKRDVATAQTFDSLWKNELIKVFSDTTVIAHNALFDLNVLAKAASFYECALPQISYACTMKLSKRFFPTLEDHRLPTVCSELGISLTDHHNALSDAMACESIFENIDALFAVRHTCALPFAPSNTMSNSPTEVVSRKMTTLYGIALGVSIDGVISRRENQAFSLWLEENQQHKNQAFFAPCFNLLDNILLDGVVTESERDAVLSITRPFIDCGCNTRSTVAMQELLGILKGVSIDRIINDLEAKNLQCWMMDHEELEGEVAFDKIVSRLSTVLNDGCVSKDEESALLDLFDQAINPIGENKESKQTGIVFAHQNFCLSGDFEHGSKSDIASLIEARGGTCIANVTKKCDYVVVGGLGSDKYAFGNYGTKVKKALELQSSGLPIQVVQEALITGRASG